MLKATVSGSFHRHMQNIYDAVGNLRDAGVDVLSPSDPRVVDYIGEFLFVASDKLRSIKLVQDRHLQAIRASDFLWLVCPDGYTGPSASMEVGVAYAYGVPVYSAHPAMDATIGSYVQHVQTMQHAVRAILHKETLTNSRHIPHVLLDPSASIAATHDALDRLEPYLLGRAGDGKASAECEIQRAAHSIKQTFSGFST